ncbi:MAG: AtpZ/AtpI family protein [Bacteroidota bacterium]
MNEEQKPDTTMRSIAPYLTLGIQLALTVVVFFFIGKYADEYFGTAPWLMIAGIAAGSIGGMTKFFKTVIALGNKEEQERRHEGE